jgi:hypothetical protein
MGFWQWLKDFVRGTYRYHWVEHVPKWVISKYWRAWKNKNKYNTIMFFKGKHYRYKIVTGEPRYQGDTPMTFYRRLRRPKKKGLSYEDIGRKNMHGGKHTRSQYKSHGYKIMHGG